MTPETFNSFVVCTSASLLDFGENTYQDLESSVEAHLQVPVVVFVERSQETLLEDRSHERVGDDHETVGSVGEGLHLEQTDLIETTSVNVDGVTILRCALGQSLVVLLSARSPLVDAQLTFVARLKCFTLSRSIS